jgi:hypothetical protein
VKLIYNNTRLDSQSRQVAIDSIIRLADGKSPTIYEEFSNENSFFRSDQMAKVRSSLAQIASTTDEVEFENYYIKDEK